MNEVISSLNLLVPGWKETEPTYQQAMIDVPKYLFIFGGELLFQLRWMIKYKLLKQSYTDSDREYLCRKHHKKTELELRYNILYQ